MHKNDLHFTSIEAGFKSHLLEVLKDCRIDPDKAIRLAKKAFVELGENVISESLHAFYLQVLARGHYWKGDFKTSIEYFNEVLEFYEKNEVYEEIISSKNWLGSNYRAIGEVDKALELHLESLTLAKELKLTHLESSIYTFIGVMYKSIGKPDEAAYYFENALEFSGENKPVALSNLASVYSSKRDFEKAFEYTQEAYELKYSAHPFLQGIIIINLTIILSELRRFDEIVFKVRELKKLKANIPGSSFNYRYSTGLMLVAVNCLKVETKDAAAQKLLSIIDTDEHLDSVLKIIDSNAELLYRISACELLLEYYNFYKAWKKVYKFQKILIELNSQRYEKEKMQALENLRIRHEVAKKERRIKIQALELTNRELELKKKRELERVNLQLEEKVAHRMTALSLQNQQLQEFAFIVSHDLREPLCNIHGISSLLLAIYQKDLARYTDLQELIIRIGQRAEHANILLKEILDYTILNEKMMVNTKKNY